MNRILSLFLAFIASAMLFVALLADSQQPSVHAQQGGVPTPTPAPEIEPRNEQVPHLEGKINPPKYDGMDYFLNEIVRQVESGALTARAAAGTAPLHREESVAVTFHIEEEYVRDVWDYLQANDVPAREPQQDEHFIEAEVPVGLLATASELPGVIVVKPIVPPQPAQFSVGGQGATVHGARVWHSAGYRGQGVKVGVIDLGFRGFSGLQGTELPSSVQARCYGSLVTSNLLSDCAAQSSHGTAVSEVLYETAPGASYYISRVYSKGTVRLAVNWMVSQGVDVITTSNLWLWDGPGNGTSPFTDSPLNSVSTGVSGGSVFTIAAGNEGQATWFGSFSDPDNDSELDFVTGDECNSVSLSANERFVAQLRWQGTWRGATRDLDLYLLDTSLNIVASSEGDQSGRSGDNPREWISYTPSSSGQYCLSIEHESGALPSWVQLQAFSGETLERTTESHGLGNPAETKRSGALAVGASPWYRTTAYFSISSRGPLPDGTIKPDIMGVSGIDTAVYGTTVYGTSFAAPHIAGLAALVKQRFPSKSPSSIASYLKTNAQSRGRKPNNNYGHGFAKLPALPTPEPLSTDATLSGLTLSGVNFGTFSSDTESYTASVAYRVSQTTITPTVKDSGATYVIKLGGVTDTDGTVSLAVGRNVITIGVKAEDDTTTKTYTVTVTRAAASTDATLSGLTLSGIDFGTFASDTESYTASVANTMSQTTVTPTVNDSGASYVIKLDGVPDSDGVIPLSVGRNVITIEVTAEDDTTKTYTVTVTRAAASTDATLSGLTLSDVDFGTFTSGTESYTATIANTVSQTTVSPTVNDSGASYVIKLDGVPDSDGVIPLSVGRNVITIEVTAEDDTTTKTYTVTVTRAAPPSTDATLKALTLSGIDFGTFSSDRYSYTAGVANSVSRTTVVPTVNDSGASYAIKIGGVTDADGTFSLAVGRNVITVVVTAEDTTTTRAYTVTVTRAAPPSSDATLKSLSLSNVSIGNFNSVTTSYTAQVSHSVSQTTVTPTVNHSGATYVIKLDGVTDSDGVIPLSVGQNVITIEVTAEDRQTTGEYTVTITRAAPPSTDATLSALTLRYVNIGAFSSDTTSYSASVANSVTQTTVMPTLNDSGARYVVKLGGVTDADGTVSLNVGSNVITIEVTAEDTTTTRTYTVTIARAAPPSTDAMLSALTLRDVDFGIFDSTTLSYAASVANSVSQTTVTPTVNDSGASYLIKLGGVTDTDGTVSLSVGKNVITIEVTAEDTTTTRTYTVTVTRAEPPSTDATLSALTLSDVDFGNFSSATTSYTASVANSLSQTTVTPTVNDSGASYVIKLGGVTDADGTVSLAVGSNIITIEVTAEDTTTTRTYTVTVTRAAPPSTDATLSALTLRDVDFGIFDSTTLSYAASVANSVSQTTVTPTVNDSGASYLIKLGGVTDTDGTVSLSVGKNVITIEVTAEDTTTTRTHTVTVTRAEPPSTDATLSALTLSDVDFGNFSSATTSYTASVANSLSQTTVTPTVNDSGASYVIKLGGVTDADGTVSLAVGSNIITIEVTAEDTTTTRTYTVTVTRAAPPSTDATLSALTLRDVDFGIFDSTTLSYAASVANSVSQTTVTPTVNDSGASYLIKLGGVTDTDGTVSLSVGKNVITIEVTAEDTTTTRTHTVTVTRAEPPSTDATLSALTLSDVDFGNFSSATTSYTASVANSLSQTTVTPTVNDSGASYVIKLGGTADADGTVSLAVGSNIITIEVTAEDTTTTRTHTVTVTRAAPVTPKSKSSDSSLSSLTMSGVNFGTFDSTTSSYTARVANSVSQTTVTPTVNDAGASYVIKLGGVTDADGTISLSVGRNVITIEVTAEDTTTTRTHTVTVTRAEPPSTDATLSALTLSDVDFGNFSSATTSYTASVANSVSQTTVTPTVNDSGASYVIKLGGTADADGTVSLAVGSNVITIEVTAEDTTTTRTHTVTVTRAAPTTPRPELSDSSLSSLTMSGVNFGTFDSTTSSYTARVANSVSQTTVTPTANHSGASYVIKLGGVTDADGTISLSVGRNVITIEVTAEDGQTTRTYTVTVTRSAPPSSDATLSALTLSDVDFGNFSSATTSYTASVANSVSQTTVTPTVNDSGASYVIKLGGTADADGTVSLAVGSNVITIEVTAEDTTTTRTHTVTVTRAAPTTPRPELSDSSLSSLTMSGVNFGTFDSTTSSYTARVANSVSQTTVTPTANHSGASYVIKLGGVTDADGTISLSVGRNVITIEVTAEDGQTTRTYTVTVTRSAPPSSDATLSALTLSGLNFGTFAPGTTSYTARVANGVTQTTVIPTVNHFGASYVTRLGGVTDADGTISLAVGSNLITVRITAQDGQTARTYTVNVTRAEPLSSDATLRALTLSGVDFGTFDSSRRSYSAQVANSVVGTTVRPTPNDSFASYVIRLGGVTDTDGTVSLAVGRNVIAVEVTAEDGTTKRTYTVTVTRASQDETPPPSDTPVTGELPTDDPKVNFRISGYTHDWVDIAWAVPQNRDITRYVVQRYEHDGDGFVSSGSGTGDRFEGTTKGGEEHSVRSANVEADTLYQYVLSLNDESGTTIIESSATVRTLSSDATLSDLTLSDIGFGTFDPETTSYTAEVANDVSETTVTPTVNHSGATYAIELDGGEVADDKVELAVGENIITIEVTAEDGETTLTYIVTITREEPYLLTGELHSDDPPVNFRITGYAEDEGSLAWEVPYNRGIIGYVLERRKHDGIEFALSGWSVSGDVVGGSSATESDTSLTADSLYRYDLALMSEDGTIVIGKSLEVRALTADAAALSADATLSALSLSGVELDPSFVSSTYHYTVSVANDVSQTTVTASLNNAAASYAVKLGGTVDEDGAVDLTPGRNVITVHVTAEDGVTTRVYTVVVSRTKAADELSTDASLRSLWLRGIDFGAFDPDTTSYTADVTNDVTQTTVTPVMNDIEAAHVIKLDGTEDTDGAIDLAVGGNVVTVEVTAEDGETTLTYTVTVTREEAADPEPADTCVQSVETDGAIAGSWDDTCLSEKDVPGGTGDRYARFYTFTLDEAADIVISLSSDEDTYLYLLNGHGKGGNTLHSNDDIAGGGVNLNSRLSVTLQPGSYTIEATTYKPATVGSFTLTIAGLVEVEETTPEPAPEPEADTCIGAISGDGTIEGSWDDTCLSEKDAPGGTGDRYARFYTFTLDEAADIVISLSSDADAYLYLLDDHGKDGDTLHSNDDIAGGGVNLNSRLSVTLQPGSYTIEATTYKPATVGSFTLTIAGLIEVEETTPEPAPEPEADTCIGAISGDGTIEGSWDDSCLSDKAAPSGTGGRYARFYTFTLEETADVTITLESDEDTYIYLLEGRGRSGTVLYEEDDIVYGVDTNSKLSENLQAGEYTIEATTFYAQTDGYFSLKIEGLGSSQ